VSTVAPERTNRKGTNRQQPVTGLIPFTAAAHQHVEGAFLDSSNTPGTTIVDLPIADVPAYGFMRHIYLLISASGGVVGTSAALGADAPWNVLSEVTLLDVNGAPIFGPFAGYQLYLANLFGGYTFRGDPALAPDADVTSTIAFTFGLRIPVEIQENNGLGALANQNAAAAYKLRIRLNTSANIWPSDPPATIPAVRVRAYLEAWSQPNPTDLLGRPQAIRPPRHGTTQYWSVQSKSAAVGSNRIKTDRVGNLIRKIILVNRITSSGARSTADFPDPIEIDWDARQLLTEPRFLRRQYMAERFVTPATMPAGVFVFDFDHDTLGHSGDGTPEQWLATVQATRLEFFGTWTTDACTLEIITNDVAPVEVDPAERYMLESDTGFDPEVGVPVRGASA
jgi:hypothetical protein